LYMLEIVALMITVGAVAYHHADTTLIALVMGALVFACVIVCRSWRGFVCGLVLAGAVALGALAVWQAEVVVDPGLYGKRAFDARVVSVDRRLEKTNVVVIDTEFDQKIQLSTTVPTDALPGDRLGVRAEVERAEDFTTDTGRVFGYRAYLESKGIVAVARNAVIGPVMSSSVSLVRIPTKLRYAFADICSRYVSFPFDGVLAGMVVGYQGGLPQSIQDLFRNTGVLHVLVLSGYNITLLAGFLAILLKGLPFRMRSVVTIIAIVLIVLVSGAGVASIRAGIMGGIAVFAGLSIRTYQPVRALTISYLVFFFISPTTLFVDPGFHLSFLATLFMIVVLPKVETLFLYIPKTKHVDLRELIMLAVSAPIFMLPYMMYFSGLFPLSSPLANILFALITPIIMIAGIILIALSWMTPIATFVGVLLSAIGSATLWLLNLCNRLPIWNTPPIAWWSVVLIYAVVLGVLFRRELRESLLQQYKMLRHLPNS
jgi:competence protein ComEC